MRMRFGLGVEDLTGLQNVIVTNSCRVCKPEGVWDTDPGGSLQNTALCAREAGVPSCGEAPLLGQRDRPPACPRGPAAGPSGGRSRGLCAHPRQPSRGRRRDEPRRRTSAAVRSQKVGSPAPPASPPEPCPSGAPRSSDNKPSEINVRRFAPGSQSPPCCLFSAGAETSQGHYSLLIYSLTHRASAPRRRIAGGVSGTPRAVGWRRGAAPGARIQFGGVDGSHWCSPTWCARPHAPHAPSTRIRLAITSAMAAPPLPARCDRGLTRGRCRNFGRFFTRCAPRA